MQLELPEIVSHLVFDWDGTLVHKGVPQQEIYARLAEYAKNKIYVTIITGRSTAYAKKYVFDELRKRLSDEHLNFINIYSELGTVRIHSSGEPEIHPEFMESALNLESLATLMKSLFQKLDLHEYYELNADPEERLTHFSFSRKDRRDIHPKEQEIKDSLAASRLAKFFSIYTDKYGIHFYPVGKRIITKGFAIRDVVQRIAKHASLNINQITNSTLIFGDRDQDYEMSKFKRKHIPLFFAGKREEYEKIPEANNVIATAIPSTKNNEVIGVNSVTDALNNLEQKGVIKPF